MRSQLIKQRAYKLYDQTNPTKPDNIKIIRRRRVYLFYHFLDPRFRRDDRRGAISPPSYRARLAVPLLNLIFCHSRLSASGGNALIRNPLLTSHKSHFTPLEVRNALYFSNISATSNGVHYNISISFLRILFLLCLQEKLHQFFP